MTLNNPSSHPASLLGQIAVVTGSTSGIGRAVALELAHQGADIVIHGRSQARAEELATEIAASGRQAKVVLGDLAEAGKSAGEHAGEHAGLVAAAWDWRGAVDIWINNAGADVLTGEAASLPFNAKLALLWQVDVLATIGLSRLIGQRMRERGRGTIVNLGWDQAEQGMAGDSGEMFAAVKGAVMAFTRSLSQSLAPEVRVNCLAPGWIKTAWGADTSPYWQTRAERESLRGRWGEPSDVARAAAFLVSPAADFITGQTLAVNGGFRFAAAQASGPKQATGE